jgi:hypothetical protein
VTFIYDYTDGLGCMASQSATIEVHPSPTIVFTNLDPDYCANAGLATFMVSPSGSSLNISPNVSGALIFVTESPDGDIYNFDPSVYPNGETITFTYSHTDFFTGCSATLSQTTTVHPVPTIVFTSLETEYCVDDAPDNFEVSPLGGTMTISPNVSGALTFNGTEYTFDPSVYPNGASVTFTYDYIDGFGCSASSSQAVMIFLPPTVSILGLVESYCEEESAFTITGNSNSPVGVFTTSLPSGFMDNGNGTATVDPTAIPTNNTYSISYSVVNANGCEAITTEYLIINENPTVSFTGLNTLYCGTENMTVLIGSEGGGTFLTIPAGGIVMVDNQPNFDPTQFLNIGTVEVIYEFINAESCMGTSSQFTNVVEAATANFTTLASFYCDSPSTLSISGIPLPNINTTASFETNLPTNAFTDNGNGTASINFGNAIAGQGYFISYLIENTNGCTDTYTQDFDFGTNAPISFTDLNGLICALTAPIELIGNPLPNANTQAVFSSSLLGNIGLTDNGDGTGILDPSTIPTNLPFKIYYTYTDENNCTKVDSQAVIIGEEEIISFTGIDGSTVCNDLDQLVLNPSHPGQGEWVTSPPGLINVNNTTVTLSLAGIPVGTFVEVTYSLPSAGSCTENFTNNFLLLEAPNFTLAETLVVCQLGTISILPQNPLDEIMWSTGEITSEITIQEEGIYTVNVTAANGCMVEDSVSVLVESGLSFLSNFLVANNACSGDTIHFIDISSILVNATSYKWNFGDGSTISTERDPTHIYLQGGEYEVNFTAFSDGCDSIDITKTITIFGCLSLPQDELFEKVIAAPNPSTGDFKLEIKLHEKQPILVTLFDFKGSKIDERSFNSDSSFLVEFKDLDKGFYSVVIQSLKERKVVKVMIIK